MFYERYDKKVIESFAIRTISKFYCSSYGEYIAPDDTDNFDYVSPDGKHGVEVTLVVSNNERRAYEYEKQFAKGKKNLKTKGIHGAKLKENGELFMWDGGNIRNLVQIITDAVRIKERKAERRFEKGQCNSADLCICVDDGGWFNAESFLFEDMDFSETIFDKIFFITGSLFFVYTKEHGFEQCKRVIE